MNDATKEQQTTWNREDINVFTYLDFTQKGKVVIDGTVNIKELEIILAHFRELKGEAAPKPKPIPQYINGKKRKI